MSVTLHIPPEWAGKRLDAALAHLLPDFSRSRLKRLIESGAVAREEGLLHNPNDKARAGERIVITPPAPLPLDVEPQDIPLVVCHEDAHLLVIDKPAGIAVHPGAGQSRDTLVNAILFHCPDLAGIGDRLRPGIVHRIDQDTSGLLVVAKDDRTHQGLSAQFAAHTTKRHYLALTRGQPRPAQGTINAPLGRHPNNRLKMAVLERGGRHAITHYQVEKAFLPASGGAMALLSCRLETGRTHQIRVHLAHLGHPLIGDPLYGRAYHPPASIPDPLKGLLAAFKRQALHAASLGFVHPISGETLFFRSPPPADFQELLAALQQLE